MKNKCTLIVDGNWLLQSRMSVMIDQFNVSLDESLRENAYEELSSRLAYSIIHILNRFPVIDNLVIVADGGSWRKKLPRPTSLQDITYKGNRKMSEERDWNRIYRALNNLTQRCEDLGITSSRFVDIEGDDWCWYWSRRLNAEGTHCIIWTIDNDLKQLVQVYNGSFTAWYNDRNGLFLHESLREKEMDDLEFFMTSQSESPILNELKRNSSKVTYLDPNSVILNKIICGDSSDNIKSIVMYSKNGRNRRIGEKECDKLLTSLNISTIEQLRENKDTIIDSLMNKYKELALSRDEMSERFDYNEKLVWLDEQVIPQSIQAKMCEQEYKQYDLSYIRNNASVLLKEDKTVENIFNGINF